MKRREPALALLALGLISILALAGCSAQGKGDPKAEAPPPAEVERVPGAGQFKVDDPAKFPLAVAGERRAAPELNVTGVVSADVSRNIPVVTLATGGWRGSTRGWETPWRRIDCCSRCKARMSRRPTPNTNRRCADETLAQAQLERAKLLLDKGAIAQKDVEVAEDAGHQGARTR